MRKQILLLMTLLVVGFGTALFQETTINIQTGKIIETKSGLIQKDINTPLANIARSLESFNNSITKILLFLGQIVLILLILIIIQRIFLLVWNRSSQLVIDNFKNASGNDELNSVLPGLSQLAREKLVREMRSLHHRLKEHVDTVAPRNYRTSDELRLPRATPDQRLTNLVDSLNEFTPDQIDPVVQLLNVVFPIYGTKVTSILQTQGKDNEKIGITFEITDIEGHFASKLYTKLYTVWEFPHKQEQDQNQDQVVKEIKEIDDISLSLKDRYRLLLKPATRWLAIELSRREMVAAVPQFYFGKKRMRYQAQIHNFFGLFYYVSAPTHGLFFYKLAIEDLKQAIKLCPDWYQPHKNLAHTYSTKGRQIQNISRQNTSRQNTSRQNISREDTNKQNINGQNNKGKDLQRKAILEYDIALKKCADKEAIRSIRVGKAISQLLSGDPIEVREAKDEIEYLEENWDATFEMNGRFIYSMAVWYAITFAQGYGSESIKKIAQSYLVYALVRDTESDLWNWAGKDPDFEKIRGDFTELRFVLLKKLNRFSQLPKLKGEEFAKAIEEILKESNWLEEGVSSHE